MGIKGSFWIMHWGSIHALVWNVALKFFTSMVNALKIAGRTQCYNQQNQTHQRMLLPARSTISYRSAINLCFAIFSNKKKEKCQKKVWIFHTFIIDLDEVVDVAENSEMDACTKSGGMNCGFWCCGCRWCKHGKRRGINSADCEITRARKRNGKYNGNFKF